MRLNKSIGTYQHQQEAASPSRLLFIRYRCYVLPPLDAIPLPPRVMGVRVQNAPDCVRPYGCFAGILESDPQNPALLVCEQKHPLDLVK